MRLDIVIPAHNEEDRIGRTLDAYTRSCRDADVRFVVALDSCTDRTAAVVRHHRARDHRVQLIEYPRLGKGGVIAETFGRSDAELVGFVDADGATPPDELLRLAHAARRADGAIASRRHPASVLPARRPLTRQITSAGFAAVVRRLMRLPYADTQCGAKVLRREVVEDVLPRLRTRDLLFDVDLLAAAGERGWRIVEVPTVWIDQEGSRVRPLADTRRMGLSLARLWVRRRLGGGSAGAAAGGAGAAGGSPRDRAGAARSRSAGAPPSRPGATRGRPAATTTSTRSAGPATARATSEREAERAHA